MVASGSANDEELLKLAVQNTVEVAIVVFGDQGVLSWNRGAETLLGYRSEQLQYLDPDTIFTPADRASGAPRYERESAIANGRAEDERWHVRADGSTFWASGVLTVLPDGRTFVKVMRDQTAKRLAEERLQHSEARFRTLAVNIPQLVFRSRNDGARTWVSPQWILYTGLSDERSAEFGWLDAIHPEDRPATLQEWRRAQEKGRYYVEHRIWRAADGEYRWHQTRAAPLPTAQTHSEWVGTCTDIHQLRGLQDAQRVLLAELQHRTRNLLALVQAVMRRSARKSASVAEFTQEFEERLRALSRAESLVANTADGFIDMRTLIQMELSAHSDATENSNHTRLDGPAIRVPASSAQVLVLALHELTTNAVKYGALGQENGRLSISWTVEPCGREHCIALDWSESGVAMPDPSLPRRKGYGSELIERALPYQLNAQTNVEYRADGMRCAIKVPLAGAERQEP